MLHGGVTFLYLLLLRKDVSADGAGGECLGGVSSLIDLHPLAFLGSKLFLSLFRLVAIVLVGYYMWLLTKREQVRRGFYFSLALILAGAAGNLIDCMFYGLCFSSSMGDTLAQFVGFAGEGHYAGFLEGRVVDMFELPFTFVWNIADAAITIGVILLLLFYRKDLGKISLKSE